MSFIGWAAVAGLGLGDVGLEVDEDVVGDAGREGHGDDVALFGEKTRVVSCERYKGGQGNRNSQDPL